RALGRKAAEARGGGAGDTGTWLEARAAAASRVEPAPAGAGHLALEGQLLRIHVVGAARDVGGALAEIEPRGGEHGEMRHHVEERVDHDLIEAHAQAADLPSPRLIIVRPEPAGGRAGDHPAAPRPAGDVAPVREGGRV